MSLKFSDLFCLFVVIVTSVVYSSSVRSKDVLAVGSSTPVSLRSYLAVKKSIPRPTKGSKRKTNPFASPSRCSLTVNELKLMDELLSSFNDNNVENNQTKCDELINNEPLVVSLGVDRCSQLKESITNNVNDLKIVFQCLKITGDNDERYEELKKTYEKKVINLQQQVVSVEKKFERKFMKIINDWKRRFQKLEKKMNVTLVELEKERLGRQEANTKLILEYLENGKIELAWSTFKNKLMGHSQMNIDNIVKSAVRKEMGTNITTQNVIKFIYTEGLRDDADAMAHGAVQLFVELEHRQALDAETVVILHEAVVKIIKACRALEGTVFETLNLILDEDIVDRIISVYNKLEFWVEYAHQQ